MIRRAVFSIEMASAVFPFLNIKTMPSRPNTILEVAIKVVNVCTSTILYTFLELLFIFLHFIVEIFKPMIRFGYVVLLSPSI
jgi:hypothetical protein